MKRLLICLFTLLMSICMLAPEASVSQDFDIRGRMHMDAFFGLSDADAFSNGFNNRRARLGMSGQLTDNWHGIVEFDFADRGLGANDVRMRRTFSDGSRLYIGNFKVPQGLNELTSSNTIRFIERSSPSNIVTDSRRMGVMYERLTGRFGYQVMFFGRAMGQRAALDGDMPMGGAFRGVFAPDIGAANLHLGASVVYEDLMDNDSVSFSDRPEARDSKGGAPLIRLDIGNGVESTLKIGAELAYLSGPFWFEAEYLQVNVSMDQGKSPSFYGFHAQAGYVLTGESRGYSTGRMGNISPGDSGAWEVALRFSHMNLEDGVFAGGKQNNITAALNYYVTSYLRFMANVIYSDVSDSPLTPDINPVIVALRAQYNF